MKTKKLITGIVIFAILQIGTFLVHAGESEGTRMENVEWKWVVYVKYHEGQYGKAKKLIKEYFMAAAEKAGTSGPSLILDMRTGQWDRIVVWDMEGGVTDLTWQQSPDGLKWRAALNKIAGSEEAAQEIIDEHTSLIASRHGELATVEI